MSQIAIAPVTLSFRYFGAGPGRGGISELSIQPSEAGTRVRFDGDLTGNNVPKEDTDVTVPSEADWRAIVGIVGQSEVCAFLGTIDEDGGEYPWPHLMEISGEQTLFVELLQLSWAGPPLSGLAHALTAGNDDQVVALRASVGPLTAPRVIRRLLRIDEQLPSEAGLGEVIKRIPPHSMTLPMIRRVAGVAGALNDATKAAQEAANHLKDAQRTWDIAGLLPEIERAMASWEQQNPSPGGIAGWSWGAERSAVNNYLRSYVAEHRALPTGSHALTVKFMGSTLKFTVDFDSL